jgi:hypothetical protein
MRRIWKLNTPLLALVLTVPAEIAFCLVGFVAGRMGRPGEPTLFLRCWGLFHDPADRLSLECLRFIRPPSIEPTRSLIFIFLALLQWYLLLLLGISLYRRFSRRTA